MPNSRYVAYVELQQDDDEVSEAKVFESHERIIIQIHARRTLKMRSGCDFVFCDPDIVGKKLSECARGDEVLCETAIGSVFFAKRGA